MPSAPVVFWERNKERIFVAAFSLLLFYSFVRAIFKAATRLLWYDELCTWIVAMQPGLLSIWHALMRAADSHPPPYYAIEKFFGSLIHNEQIAFRLPSILGFCVVELCLFLWVKKCHNAATAFVASLIPLMTPLYSTYAVEARPYCVLAACLSVAMLGYQRATSRFWILVLALSLFAAECSHYYAVFMLIPFFGAETLYLLKTKCIRWAVWISLCAGFVPLLVCWPLLMRFKAHYLGTIWYGQSTLIGTLRVYAWLFGVSYAAPNSGILDKTVVVLLAFAIAFAAALLLYRSFRENSPQKPGFHEDVLVAGILLCPLIMFLATKISHTGLMPRYMLPATIGVAIVFGYGLSFFSRKIFVLVGALLFANFAVQEAGFWFDFYQNYQLGFVTTWPAVQLLRSANHVNLPVVVSEGHDYLELAHYAPPTQRERFVFLAAAAAAAKYHRPDTNDKELLILRDLAPLQVFEYEKFKQSHSEFLLFSDPTPENDPDWFADWLAADGWSLQKVATDNHSAIFFVTSKAKTH